MEKEIFIPIVIGNCAPFRLVLRDTDKWSPTLKEINTLSYDYVKLNRNSTNFDIGIRPFSLIIGFDETTLDAAFNTILLKSIDMVSCVLKMEMM